VPGAHHRVHERTPQGRAVDREGIQRREHLLVVPFTQLPKPGSDLLTQNQRPRHRAIICLQRHIRKGVAHPCWAQSSSPVLDRPIHEQSRYAEP
jgi:hypothetical protein